MRGLSWTRAALVAVWPLATASAEAILPPEQGGGFGDGNPRTGLARLYDSVDENLNPVSMRDLVDGRPLVLVVSSCTCQPGYLNFQVLEETYQKYKDKINFLWVYAREAHPEELWFWPGYRTEDLGWDHRYFRSRTMEERARRAGWMKTQLEPDAEIPMLIDYINSPLGADDRIWSFYTGGGFYAGFVIDCDRSIIQSLNWGWFAPGSQFWNLPLAPLRALEDFLDDYLATTPACYVEDPEVSGPSRPRPVETILGQGEGSPTVLIVDDDGGSAYEGYFKIPLGNLKKHYRVWDVQKEGSPAGVLENYRVVVWSTGDTRQDTLTGQDRVGLAAYLDSGGKLLLSGTSIGQDIGGSWFYNHYLHATAINDEMETILLLGDDILSGVDIGLGGGWDGEPNQRRPTSIGLADGASGVLFYDTPGERAWGGLRWEGDHQLVYLAFGFEAIGNLGAAAHRFKIMKKVFAWFDELPCPADIGLDGGVDIHDFELFADSMAGPDRTEPPPDVDFTHFAKSDLDLDEDVDLEDFADLQRRFGDNCDAP